MNKFIPSPDYEGLRIQAFALANLVRCMEQTKNAGAKFEIAKLKGQLESEREMNAVLTAENEELLARIVVLSQDVLKPCA